jgi:DNA-binding GntR family transcriptional regulator
MADIVAETLRNMILVGDLEPGRRTTQDELAKLLSVSTMPVREALLKLSAQGLIEASPNRSFRVRRTTREDIKDTYWQHATLAGELTRRACVNRTDALLAELRNFEIVYKQAVERHDAQGMEAANWQFHRAINLAADSPRLLFMLKVTLGFIPDGMYPQVPAWGQLSVNAHLMIISAMSAGYADAAAQAAAAHVREAGELLVELLENRGFWKNAESNG